MTLEDVDRLLAFFRHSNYQLFRVMGGEPTLHPNFVEILCRALAFDMRVDVLSNATWNDACAEFFTRVSPRRLYFLLNLDHPDRYRPGFWQRIERNLARLPHPDNVTLSFNIFERVPRYEYVLDVARRFGFKTVRLSFALPILGARNQCLDLDDYRSLTPFVLRFVQEAEAQDVQVQIDNAIPLCIFDEAAIGRLLLRGIIDLQRNARCEPVIDIGPELSVWCCFCLSAVHNRRLDEFDTLQQVKEYYLGVLGRYQRELTPLDECNSCFYRKQWGCQGGCITHSILRRKDTCPDYLLPEPAPFHVSHDAGIELAEGAELRRYSVPEDCLVIGQKGQAVEVELSATLFGALAGMLDGSYSLGEIVGRCREAARGSGESPLDAFENEEKARGVEDVLIGLVRQGLLTAGGSRMVKSA
jgi:MoaA/NifB/PqqE/SkfB family radical SAM enzyme